MRLKPSRLPQSNRGPVKAVPPQASSPIPFPAPAKGLHTAIDASQDLPGAASVLTNWIPTLTGARVRGGSVRKAIVSGGLPFVTAFTYRFGGAEKQFMATASAIYDMTSPAAPPAVTAPAITGMFNGNWSAFQHSNAAGSYLVITNGANTRRVFDGTTWTTPSLTFTDGTTPSQLSQGWLFKRREFYVKGGTLDAYYLDVNAIGGPATLFPLGGTFKLGGSLLMGFSWSIESGAGPNEYCAFVTTEGEIAVYGGSDPDTDFGIIGTYQIDKPLGKNAFVKVGGDVLIATASSLTPMSQVLQRQGDGADPAALAAVSKSRPIDDLWRMAALAVSTGWALTYWPQQNVVLVSFPDNIVVPDTTFVYHVLTGAWSLIKNWKATCYSSIQGSLFFGSIGGLVWQGDIDGRDDGLPFQAGYLSQFRPGSTLGQRKEAAIGQMFIKAKDRPNVLLFARADGDTSVPSLNVVTLGDSGSSEWDVGLWDVAIWDASSVLQRFEYRQNVRATGDTLALGAVIVSSGQVPLRVALDLGSLQVIGGEQSA